MSEKKFTWKKKHGSGINVLVVDGERVTIRPGDHVFASISELGSRASQYEPAAASTRKRELTALEIEVKKNEEPLKLKSLWLNPAFRAGIGSIEHKPNDVKGLREVLAGKQSQDFNKDGQAVGELGTAKLELKNAWNAWKYQVSIDPKNEKSLKEPEEPWLSPIAEAMAKLNILQSEIREIKILLEVAESYEKKISDNRAQKLKDHGFSKLRNHKYFEVDGRAIEYKDNKPFFKDDGQSVLEYLENCKKIKTERMQKERALRAKTARERREQTEAAA